jgi:methionyl-tRNA formyltransferase
MNFGKINKIILFGGGRILLNFGVILDKYELESIVITSNRHAKEIIDNNNTFEELLTRNQRRFIITADINESRVINEITPETLGISSSAAWLFKAEFIDLFGGKLLNGHASRLPHDRGAGGFSWRIMRNEPLGAVLLHKIDPGVDTGEIVKYEEYVFPADCRKPVDYQEYTLQMYLEFLEEFIKEVLAGEVFSLIPQQESFSIYFPRLHTDVHGFIDWSWTAEEIESFICAFDTPYKGASTFIEGTRVRLKDCHLTKSDGTFHPFQFGIIYRIAEYGLFVAAKGGSLIMGSVENEEGKSILEKMRLGGRFYTPVDHIEKAKTFRAVYTPDGLLKKH